MAEQNTTEAMPRMILAGKSLIGFETSATPAAAQTLHGTETAKTSFAKSGKSAQGNAFALQAPRL